MGKTEDNNMPKQCNRFASSTQAVLVDIEGVLMDTDSAATSAAIVDVFGRRDVTITSAEAQAKPSSVECNDNHQLRNELRAVMNGVADKWQAAKGAAPTEWDLEAMWKEIPQVLFHRPLLLLRCSSAGCFRPNESGSCCGRCSRGCRGTGIEGSQDRCHCRVRRGDNPLLGPTC